MYNRGGVVKDRRHSEEMNKSPMIFCVSVDRGVILQENGAGCLNNKNISKNPENGRTVTRT